MVSGRTLSSPLRRRTAPDTLGSGVLQQPPALQVLTSRQRLQPSVFPRRSKSLQARPTQKQHQQQSLHPQPEEPLCLQDARECQAKSLSAQTGLTPISQVVPVPSRAGIVPPARARSASPVAAVAHPVLGQADAAMLRVEIRTLEAKLEEGLSHQLNKIEEALEATLESAIMQHLGDIVARAVAQERRDRETALVALRRDLKGEQEATRMDLLDGLDTLHLRLQQREEAPLLVHPTTFSTRSLSGRAALSPTVSGCTADVAHSTCARFEKEGGDKRRIHSGLGGSCATSSFTAVSTARCRRPSPRAAPRLLACPSPPALCPLAPPPRMRGSATAAEEGHLQWEMMLQSIERQLQELRHVFEVPGAFTLQPGAEEGTSVAVDGPRAGQEAERRECRRGLRLEALPELQQQLAEDEGENYALRAGDTDGPNLDDDGNLVDCTSREGTRRQQEQTPQSTLEQMHLERTMAVQAYREARTAARDGVAARGLTPRP